MVGSYLQQVMDYNSRVVNSLVFIQGFTSQILDLLSSPLLYKEFKNYLEEIEPKKKKKLISFMKLPVRSSKSRQQYTDSQIIKQVRSMNNSLDQKEKFYCAIMLSIIDVYEDKLQKLSIDHVLEQEEEIVNDYGTWHYYWVLRLFPIQSENIEKRIQLFDSDVKRTHSPSIIEEGHQLAEERSKLSKVIAAERERRISAEKAIEKLEAYNRDLEGKLSKISAEKETLNIVADERKHQLQELSDSLEIERKKYYELEGTAKNLENLLLEARNNIQAKNNEVTPELNNSLNNVELHSMAELIIDAFYEDLMKLNMDLRIEGVSQEKQKQIREKISDCIVLIDSMEKRFLHNPVANDNQPEEANEMVVFDKKDDRKSGPFQGTFYRRDHGGYLIFENHERINLSESIVNATRLEHEAEIECELTPRPDGTYKPDITILLQGDDRYAPINQYWGVVKYMDSHYYCVDVNNSDNCFPLYQKDFEIQQPQDGDPCLFNVSLGGEYARISKLYKQHGKQVIRTNVKSNQYTELFRPKNFNQLSERKDFLKGCSVVIIGGQEKWFSSVVAETGAELFHENGATPNRIHSKLRRSNALFLLQTATSHSATGSCIGIAKQNQIPHFEIKGSKSNLRTLLWENRNAIISHSNSLHN